MWVFFMRESKSIFCPGWLFGNIICCIFIYSCRSCWGRPFVLTIRYIPPHAQAPEDFELHTHSNESVATVRRHIIQKYVAWFNIYMPLDEGWIFLNVLYPSHWPLSPLYCRIKQNSTGAHCGGGGGGGEGASSLHILLGRGEVVLLYCIHRSYRDNVCTV